MITKKTADENLLDAQLEFIMNAPQELFDEYLTESGADVGEISQKATSAFDRALESCANAKQAAEALAKLVPAEQKTIAANLGIRRSVLAAFREHRVIVASIPKPFLAQFAQQFGLTIKTMATALTAPAPRLAGEYKSDKKPDGASVRVTFEQLLRDAAMSEQDIKELMRDGD